MIEESETHYLIYYKSAIGNHRGHAVVFFVRAPTLMQAVTRFLLNQSSNMQEGEDGTLYEDGDVYSHPLAYVEAWFKSYGEWQIRHLPDWTWEQSISEVFCGESSDGPAEIIALCRQSLRQKLPHCRARAFVWYLRKGTLVTFYHKSQRAGFSVVARYLWNRYGKTECVEEWQEGYERLLTELDVEPLRY